MDNNNNGNTHTNGDHSADNSLNSTSRLETPVLSQPPDVEDILMGVDDDYAIFEAPYPESDADNTLLSTILAGQQDAEALNASSSQSATFYAQSSPSSSSSSIPQRSNRRPRVEDDNDVDRDLRHPSLRVGEPQVLASSNSPLSSDHINNQPSTQGHPFTRFFPSFLPPFLNPGDPAFGLGPRSFNQTRAPTASGFPSTNSNDDNAAAIPVVPSPTPDANGAINDHPMHFLDYEFSIVMDGSMRPQPAQNTSNDPPVQTQRDDHEASIPTSGNPGISPVPIGGMPPMFGIPLLFQGGFGIPEERDDPERAKKLVDGLEEVPVGLVRRLERVGTGGGGMGEDESKGGDVGCAVCWDRLLPEEGAMELSESQGMSENASVDCHSDEKSQRVGNADADPMHSKVVSLPCAHVFHAGCLIPWFSRPRHTTCPTCRFNIDPDNLTYVSARQRRRERRRANNANPNQPQEDEGSTNPAPAAAPPTDAHDQPPQDQPQEQGGHPFVDVGRILRMFELQGQQSNQPTTPTPTLPSQNLPPPLVMPIPMPRGGSNNIFPAGFGTNQMPMPVPFMVVPGNDQGVPIPLSIPLSPAWRRMANSTTGGNRTNPTNTTSDDASDNGNSNVIQPGTANEPVSTSNAANPPPPQPTHQPHMIADVIRISLDMVFDGRSWRRANISNPQPSDGRVSQATQDVVGDDSDEPPPLEPISDDESSSTPALNNESEQPTPENQSAEFQPPIQSLGSIHVAGAGRSFEEAFSQAMSRLHTQMSQPRHDDQNAEPSDALPNPNERIPTPPLQQAPAAQSQDEESQRPWQFMPVPFINFSIPMRAPHPDRPKRAWTLPSPPGPTLRQRIEQREREAGLRCHDVSCGLGPSDEDPDGVDVGDTNGKIQQLAIMKKEEWPVCEHRFHGACLVSAERVALCGAEVAQNEAGCVGVSCSLCRATGHVTKEQWDEGVRAL